MAKKNPTSFPGRMKISLVFFFLSFIFPSYKYNSISRAVGYCSLPF